MTKEDAKHHTLAWGEALIILFDNRAKWPPTSDEYARSTQAMLIVDAVHRGYIILEESLEK